MSIKLPKHLRGFSYDRVLPIELNSFEVEILLPAIFFKVVSEGRDRARKANDPTKIREYAGKLASHEHLAGFGDPDGQRVLDRLIRTALIQVGRRGQRRQAEQIQGLTGYTFLAFKPGLPFESSVLRKVDTLIYRMMRDQMRGEQPLRQFFQDIFGQGLKVEGGHQPTGEYDRHTELDTLSRLSIAYLDGFQPTPVRPAKERLVREACPALAERTARDFRRYLEAYRDRMPIEALTYHFRALISFEILTYVLKLFYAVVDLVNNPADLPPAMQDRFTASPPEIYLDFIGAPTGISREMAAYCVRRDLEQIQRFTVANLTLRQLDRYVHQLRGDRRVVQIVSESLGKDEGGPEYLRSMLQPLDNPTVSIRIDAAAQRDEEEIRKENAPDQVEDDQDYHNEEIDRIAEPAQSELERVTLLIAAAQQKEISERATNWFWNTAGLQKPYGVLSGVLKSRQSWRYAPSNDLLMTMVQLAAVDIPRWNKDTPRPQPIRLQEFLEWLEERFGILVDRPPDELSGADYVAAAQDNLQAMLRRLRQMGVFRDLSDDFTVQRLIPPYAEDPEEVVTA